MRSVCISSFYSRPTILFSSHHSDMFTASSTGHQLLNQENHNESPQETAFSRCSTIAKDPERESQLPPLQKISTMLMKSEYRYLLASSRYFTDAQLQILNKSFAEDSYPSHQVRDKLAVELNRTRYRIDRWFYRR